MAIDGDEEGQYKGFLTKFYSYEVGKVFINFWRMNEYGRYDGEVYRYLVAEDSACEIRANYITKVHHGYGFDFLELNFRHKAECTRVVRVCYLPENFFGSASDNGTTIDARIIRQKDALENTISVLKERNRAKSRLPGSGDGIMELDDLSDWLSDEENKAANLEVNQAKTNASSFVTNPLSSKFKKRV